ncbi:MAG: penicillin acylase family protein [Holophagaceae bacterium]|nr:penicillin acylase family protein [Holophagaceae bacterium]
MRWLKRVVMVLGVALVTGALGAWWVIQRQLPDSAVPVIHGLANRVQVAMDGRGVPTIRAGSFQDAFRVQGYLAARERLFQMELQRRAADGLLSELLGPAALPLDRTHRVYGFHQVADAALPQLPEAEREALEAFSDGVNAFIQSHPDRWGLEFKLLGTKPRPWTPADCLKGLLLMHEDLSSTWRAELRNEALKVLPENQRRALQPVATEWDQLIIPDVEMPKLDAELLFQAQPVLKTAKLPGLPNDVLGLSGMAGERDGSIGSNAWVVSGSRTASGKPMLMNDPHLGLASPGIWLPMRIEIGERFVEGVTLPFLPGITLGRNQAIAWGFTNLGTDVQDLYRESPRGERIEDIPVKGRAKERLRVPLGAHGPQVRPGYSLKWAALDPANLRMPMTKLIRATDWDSFNAACDGFLGPAQNIVYADVEGHIGYRATGLVPIRKKGDDGSLPVDGNDSSNDWQGFVSQAEMPRVLDPVKGYLVTANQRILGSGFPYPVATRWASPVRAKRIAELIEAAGKLDHAGAERIQLDVLSLEHRDFMNLAAPLLSAGWQSRFHGWDGEAAGDSRKFLEAELLKKNFRAQLLNRILRGAGWDADSFSSDTGDALLREALKVDQEAWTRAGLGDKLEALSEAARQTKKQMETAPKTWGEANRLDLQHPVGRAGGLLGWVFNAPRGIQSGANHTVRVAKPDFGQSMRFIVDWGDPGATTLVVPLGVSGHLGSGHRHDQIKDWLKGDPLGQRTRLKQEERGAGLLFPN